MCPKPGGNNPANCIESLSCSTATPSELPNSNSPPTPDCQLGNEGAGFYTPNIKEKSNGKTTRNKRDDALTIFVSCPSKSRFPVEDPCSRLSPRGNAPPPRAATEDPSPELRWRAIPAASEASSPPPKDEGMERICSKKSSPRPSDGGGGGWLAMTAASAAGRFGSRRTLHEAGGGFGHRRLKSHPKGPRKRKRKRNRVM